MTTVPTRAGSMPRLAQLGGKRLAGVHLQVAEGERADAPEALGRLDRDGRVQAGVDQDRPGAGVLDEEGDDRDRDPGVLPDPDAEPAKAGEAAGLAQR